LVDGICGLAHLFGALKQRGLVVLDLGDQHGTGLLEAFLTAHGHQRSAELARARVGATEPGPPGFRWTFPVRGAPAEHLGYWAPGRTGYTTDLVQAGRYSRAEAIDICHNALPGHWRPGLPFPDSRCERTTSSRCSRECSQISAAPRLMIGLANSRRVVLHFFEQTGQRGASLHRVEKR
jgi:hypothetical protein